MGNIDFRTCLDSTAHTNELKADLETNFLHLRPLETFSPLVVGTIFQHQEQHGKAPLRSRDADRRPGNTGEWLSIWFRSRHQCESRDDPSDIRILVRQQQKLEGLG